MTSRWRGLVVVAALSVAATGPDATVRSAPAFTFADPRLVESSGLVVSPTQDVVWTVNDSGDDARVYGVDRDGCTRVDLVLDGQVVRDVEDLGVDPRSDPATLVVADVGDNDAVRDDVALLRVAEPAVDLTGPCPGTPVTVTGVAAVERVRLATGPADVEGVLVDPRDGRVLLVTKARGGVPTALEVRDGVAEPVVEVGLGGSGDVVTGGAVRTDGGAVVLRGYGTAWRYPWRGDWAATLAEPDLVVALPVQPQGEAIAWDGDAAWLVSSEDPIGTRPPVLRLVLDEATPPTPTSTAPPSGPTPSVAPTVVAASPAAGDDGRGGVSVATVTRVIVGTGTLVAVVVGVLLARRRGWGRRTGPRSS